MVDPFDASYFETTRPVPTGNTLVLFKPKAKTASIVRRLAAASGLEVAVAKDDDDDGSKLSSVVAQGNAFFLDRLNIAVVPPITGASAMTATLMADEDVRQVRPEFYLFALADLHARYAAWVREGLHLLSDTVPIAGGPPGFGDSQVAAARAAADPDLTWGIKAIGADRSPFTGKGIKIAVLDTGLDLTHPDFQGRTIVTKSFIPDHDAVQDIVGHGTHCIGTAAGPLAGNGHARYGVASQAEIYVGKVLNDSGSGAESWVLAGMNWAIEQGCEVISMSLGRATQPGEPPDEFYEEVGKTALEAGSIIVAAAGNESARQFGHIAPVGSPANAPSIFAVAAVDSDMKIANFSCGEINPTGGEVNIAGPGVDIFSSFPMPERYKRLRGTSMATPHVAGAAALWAQSDANLRGQALWDVLIRSAKNIGLDRRDVGAGLVQAPHPTADP